MKPRKLKIKGLNSFIEEQEIDFKKLTEKGLFGIFGPTGSGKSTILDAITIALYGKIARDTNEFINIWSNMLNINYEFEIGSNKNRKVYIVDRSIKKDKQGRYKTNLARLKVLKEEGEFIVSEGARDVQKSIEEIIGLTSQDFTRSVVLPQGKFSEFLKLTGKDRRNMLERIFGLESYGKDLVEKIRRAKNEKIKKLTLLKGKLEYYNDLTEEEYKKIKKEVKSLTNEQQMLEKEKKEIDKNYEIYNEIWQLQKELKVYKSREESFKEKIFDVEKDKQKILKARNALNVKPFLDNVEEIEEKIKISEKKLMDLENKAEKVKERLCVVEKKYKNIQDIKEEEIPKLIKKDKDLVQAIGIKEKLDNLVREREELSNKYNILKCRLDKEENSLKDIIKRRSQYLKNIEDNEERINNIRINSKEKERIQELYFKEKEYEDIFNRKKELEIKIENKIKSIQEIKKSYEEEKYKQKEKKLLILKCEQKKIELEKNCPGDKNLLLEKQTELDKVKSKFEDFTKLNEKKTNTDLKYNSILNNKKLVEDKLKDIEENVNKSKNEINKLQETIKHMKKEYFASVLAFDMKEGDVCPVCGSIHHPNLAIEMDNSILIEKNKDIESLKKNLESLNETSQKYYIAMAQINKDYEYIDCERKEILKKLKSLQSEDLQRLKENLKIEFDELCFKINKWEKNKKDIEEKISKLKDEKSYIDTKEAKLSERLNKEEDLLIEFNNEIDKVNKIYKSVVQEYNNLREELKLNDATKKLKQIQKDEEEEIKLEKQQKILKTYIDKCDKEKENIKNKINGFNINIAKILEVGKEKRAYIDEYKDEIFRLSENKDPEKYIHIIRKKIDEIKKQEENLRIELEHEKDENINISEKILSEIKYKEKLRSMFLEQKNKLNKLFEENNFQDSKQVLNSILDKEEIINKENEINSFEDEFKNVKNNIIRIENKLKGSYIKEEEWETLKVNKDTNIKLLGEKVKEITIKNEKLKNMKKDLQELKKLLKEKKELEHVFSILDDLNKLVQGNKFVEFVATNQLKYISIEATKRLKEITRGRYALELDPSGNFTIRDDFNGGIIRATSTLSGGETFLTSLSLALSLSSKIQLKGNAPLEFFFLDEGFGTLDSELLEIVITSLQKLHSDKLCVGIISHIEELKNRVPVKLIVKPAVSGKRGSNVYIEYS